MLTKAKIALSAVVVLGSALTASAATTPRASHIHHRAIYNTVPDYNGNRCPVSGGPSCSDECLSSGPPCKTIPDGW
jgi:hypothetical protein